MSSYLLILHDDPTEYRDLSPAEMSAILERYTAWARDLGARGLLRGGEKLADEGGRIVRSDGGCVVVVEGPYAEAREVISGYFIIEAADYDAAVAIARDCPHAQSRGKIEVRAIDAQPDAG